MAVTNGRLEAQVTVPTGGWDLQCTDAGGGPTTVTLPAGNYYIGGERADNGLVKSLEYEINIVMGAAWTVDIDDGEGGTGLVTIGCSGATCTVSWTDTDLANLLQLDNPLSGSTSYTASKQCGAIWLPDCPWTAPNAFDGLWDGFHVSDKQEAVTASGHYYAVSGQRRTELSLSWSAISRTKTLVSSAANTNKSFETFWIDYIVGEGIGASVGGPIRFYPSADSATFFGPYSVMGLQEFRPPQRRQDYIGRWDISLPQLVKVPA